MQQNPKRIPMRWSHFCGRVYRRKINNIWMNVTCGCCYSGDAKIRHHQKRLSKETTLRTHRGGTMSTQKEFHGKTIIDLEDMVDNFVPRNPNSKYVGIIPEDIFGDNGLLASPPNPDELTEHERPSEDDPAGAYAYCLKHGKYNVRLQMCPACERMKNVGSDKA